MSRTRDLTQKLSRVDGESLLQSQFSNAVHHLEYSTSENAKSTTMISNAPLPQLEFEMVQKSRDTLGFLIFRFDATLETQQKLIQSLFSEDQQKAGWRSYHGELASNMAPYSFRKDVTIIRESDKTNLQEADVVLSFGIDHNYTQLRMQCYPDTETYGMLNAMFELLPELEIMAMPTPAELVKNAFRSKKHTTDLQY
jgi:hypothetical protein